MIVDMLKKRHLLVLVSFIIGACSGSHRDGTELTILRYDRVLFETPAAQLPDSLKAFKFPSPLLANYPDDPVFLANVEGFVNDSIVQSIYEITQKRYGNLSNIEKELNKALKKAATLDKEIELKSIAAYVSAQFDYNSRIVADRESGSMLISLDQYALDGMERYSYFGLPMFIVELSDSIYIVPDIMAELARQYIAAPDENSTTMLDLMIMEGKVLYFLDQVLPKTDDCTKIRYSKEQMEWCRKNESMIWAYFIQHNLLYEKDFTRYHNFVDEAPKTNAFKDSAPRTPFYIGWQIVRKYMEQNKCSVADLFANTDSQAILQASKYRP